MADNFTDYMEAAVMNWFRGTNMPAAPANVYVGLFTVAPTDAGGGTEVSGGGYGRVAIPWSAITGGLIENVNQIAFAVASANWGTVVAVGLFDAASGGNMVAWGALAANVTVNSGQRFVFDPNQLTLAVQ